ncbi:MAG TPA: squalene/phytoene synthase family protein [Longimicrobiaceae bacterium]|nr:squalene/phytoene synthase family protein [Longimicrobiaceae bacterium]
MIAEYQMLREVSRTFALSIEQLPRGPRDALTLGYLLLRVSDGIEDHASLPASRKIELLGLWERVLAGAAPAEALCAAIGDLDPTNPEIRVALHAPALLARLEALPSEVRAVLRYYTRQTTRGMARWQAHPPIVESEAELDDYMHQVAGIVGYLITDVFACYSRAVAARRDEMRPLAREFGLGLQTVNVLRGLPADFARGWSFVPRSFCTEAGLAGPEALFDPARRDAALAVVERLATKAERHLARGCDYIALLPRREYRLRLMCAWPLLFAARTVALSRGNPEVLRCEAKMTRAEVRGIMRRSAWRAWSDRWLAVEFRRLSAPV